jgi:hypothetical protein
MNGSGVGWEASSLFTTTTHGNKFKKGQCGCDHNKSVDKRAVAPQPRATCSPSPGYVVRNLGRKPICAQSTGLEVSQKHRPVLNPQNDQSFGIFQTKCDRCFLLLCGGAASAVGMSSFTLESNEMIEKVRRTDLSNNDTMDHPEVTIAPTTNKK